MSQYTAYTPYASQSRYGGGGQGYTTETRAPGGYCSSSRYPSSGGYESSSRYPINSGYSTLDAQASRRHEPRELRPTESKISFASAMNGLGPAPIPQGRGLRHMDSRSGLQPWERDELAESWYSGDRAVSYDVQRRHPLERASSVRHATPRSHYRSDCDSEILDSRSRPSFAFDEVVRGDAARSYGLEMRGMEAFEERERQRDREMQRRIEREERKPRGFGGRWSIVSELLGLFKSLRATGLELRIVTTLQYGTTDVKALRDLYELGNVKIKVIDSSSTFHAKSWLFRYDDAESNIAIVGSFNISRPALTDGIEWNLCVQAKSSDFARGICSDSARTFEEYWMGSFSNAEDHLIEYSPATHDELAIRSICESEGLQISGTYNIQEAELLQELQQRRQAECKSREGWLHREFEGGITKKPFFSPTTAAVQTRRNERPAKRGKKAQKPTMKVFEQLVLHVGQQEQCEMNALDIDPALYSIKGPAKAEPGYWPKVTLVELMQAFGQHIASGEMEVVSKDASVLRLPDWDQSCQEAFKSLHNGQTPLYIAVVNHELSIAEWLLQHGQVDANETNLDGTTPLIWAIDNLYLLAIKLLTDHRFPNRASVDKADRNGRTPLSIAEDNDRLHQFLMNQSYEVQENHFGAGALRECHLELDILELADGWHIDYQYPEPSLDNVGDY